MLTLAGFHLAMYKGLVHACNLSVALVEVCNLHPQCVLHKDCSLVLNLKFSTVLAHDCEDVRNVNITAKKNVDVHAM